MKMVCLVSSLLEVFGPSEISLASDSVSINTENNEDGGVVPTSRYTNLVSNGMVCTPNGVQREDISPLFRSSRSNEVVYIHGHHGFSQTQDGRTGRRIEHKALIRKFLQASLINCLPKMVVNSCVHGKL